MRDDLLNLLHFGASGWGDELLSGFLVTLELCLVSLPVGLILGLAFALAQRARSALAREVSSFVTALIRGVPEFLTLLIVYFGGQEALDWVTRALDLSRVEFHVFGAGVVTLSLILAAYSSEVFLGALRVISRSSLDAAKSLGLGPVPTLLRVILPELFRLSLPGLSNLWVSMVKQSALVSIIGYGDLLHAAYIAASSTGHRIFFYGAACLLYLAITQASEAAMRRLSTRLSRGLA